MSDVIEVRLVNRTKEPVECSYPARDDGGLCNGVEWEQRPYILSPYVRFAGSPATRVLQPGESISVPCDNEVPDYWVRKWEQGTERALRWRVVVIRYVPGGISIIRSDWFEIPIER
jgi:hypothetical protein